MRKDLLRNILKLKFADVLKAANDNFIELYNTPPGSGITLDQVKADPDIADALYKKHSPGSDNQGNCDGGEPDTNYGGITNIDAGGVI